MFHAGLKVYYDGSSYVAILPDQVKRKERQFVHEDKIEVIEEVKDSVNTDMGMPNKVKRMLTKKEYFDELYKANIGLKKAAMKEVITTQMKKYFMSEALAESYVEANIRRKKHNLGARMVRLRRKVNLHDFNYFCTFTYGDEKQTEQTFKKRLRRTFWNFTDRHDWEYVGVWERGEEGDRLHFHGMFDIPEGKMIGELERVREYSIKKKCVVERVKNSYFDKRFGRSDFKEIIDDAGYAEAIGYITKYLEKSGERIVYSKGLPQFFVSDINDDDVICEATWNPNKLILFDDFTCWDEGCKIGKVSPEVIDQLPKVM